MFVSPICTGTVLVGKEVPVTAATATMRIKKKATDKGDSESLCDKAAATTGQTHPKPISAQLNDSNRSWDSGACKTKKKGRKKRRETVYKNGNGKWTTARFGGKQQQQQQHSNNLLPSSPETSPTLYLLLLSSFLCFTLMSTL